MCLLLLLLLLLLVLLIVLLSTSPGTRSQFRSPAPAASPAPGLRSRLRLWFGWPWWGGRESKGAQAAPGVGPVVSQALDPNPALLTTSPTPGTARSNQLPAPLALAGKPWSMPANTATLASRHSNLQMTKHIGTMGRTTPIRFKEGRSMQATNKRRVKEHVK